MGRGNNVELDFRLVVLICIVCFSRIVNWFWFWILVVLDFFWILVVLDFVGCFLYDFFELILNFFENLYLRLLWMMDKSGVL